MKHIIQEDSNWFDDELDSWYIYLTEEQENELRNLTAEVLYEHLKKQIGVQTSMRGKNYFVPKLFIGGFVLSLQIGYSLWSYREDHNVPHELPMTEEEFVVICKDTNSIIDVMFFKRNKDEKLEGVGNPALMTLKSVCCFLKEVADNKVVRKDYFD